MELNKIYNIDCLEFMKTLPDKCVDLVLTDPPFGIGIAEWDKRDYYDFLFEQSMRVLKDGCYAFIFSSKKNMKRPQFTHDIFAVVKNFAQYRQHLGMFDAWYPIIYFSKGKPRKVKNPEKDAIPKRNWFLLNTANTSRNKDNPKTGSEHETPKNMELIKYFVKNFSEPNDLILDPFAGSGTTCVAAKMEGRNFIGVEISKKYCAIAEDRISHVTQKLF
jgi:site-specific DNA-methyltransferase (adenine-specific)